MNAYLSLCVNSIAFRCVRFGSMRLLPMSHFPTLSVVHYRSTVALDIYLFGNCSHSFTLSLTLSLSFSLFCVLSEPFFFIRQNVH